MGKWCNRPWGCFRLFRHRRKIEKLSRTQSFPLSKEHRNVHKIALVSFSHCFNAVKKPVINPIYICGLQDSTYRHTELPKSSLHFFGGLWSCTACPFSWSPKHQWKMLYKVISSFRLEADSYPGLVPITKVNEKHCRKFLAIQYTNTHTHTLLEETDRSFSLSLSVQ